MFSYLALTALFTAALAAPGIVEHGQVVQPVLAKVGTVVHSAPSAVSHQSFSRVHNSAVLQPVVAPVVKTTLHAVPVVHVAPVVHHAPVVHTAPIVPLVKTIYAAPLVHHAVSHVQLHHNAAVLAAEERSSFRP